MYTLYSGKGRGFLCLGNGFLYQESSDPDKGSSIYFLYYNSPFHLGIVVRLEGHLILKQELKSVK
jgi:hypothetical protein